MAASLKLQLIGYWKVALEDEYPFAQEAIAELDPTVRLRVAEYLESGLLFQSYRGFSGCRFCGEDNGSEELTDGVWIWPNGLAHYVRTHGVGLPDEFISHATRTCALPITPSSVPEKWVWSEYGCLETPHFQVDEEFWKSWAGQRRTLQTRASLLAALERLKARCQEAIDIAAAETTAKFGTSEQKCQWRGCRQKALRDRAFCARCCWYNNGPNLSAIHYEVWKEVQYELFGDRDEIGSSK